ncbi:hypothetical protein [Paenibacillus lautus]|uniref:hypothetical protein n=1 Tax=Paenibacillus lautus TaxID=1401 RepID=UPI002DB78399|nr:hypothetical protein [Paenibacillus lautus]MEC0259345.1 hypothetical protein [Paenibacillus lautus]
MFFRRKEKKNVAEELMIKCAEYGKDMALQVLSAMTTYTNPVTNAGLDKENRELKLLYVFLLFQQSEEIMGDLSIFGDTLVYSFSDSLGVNTGSEEYKQIEKIYEQAYFTPSDLSRYYYVGKELCHIVSGDTNPIEVLMFTKMISDIASANLSILTSVKKDAEMIRSYLGL